MKLDKTARAILGITALAWSVPFAQAAETRQPGVPAAQQNSARFVQLYERALAARYAADAWITAKVKTALLREKGLESFDVSVETFDNQVLLSGFVDDAEQKRKALLVASGVEGVKDVKDGLAVRK